MARKLMFLVAILCASNLGAVLISPFPGLEKLISQSDGIVILRVDRQLTDVAPTLYATYDCFVCQTLKGDVPAHKTIRLQLMDTRTSFVVPFAVNSTHLMFLTRKRSNDEPTDYRTLEIEGANVRLTPFGHEHMPEGKTIEDRIRLLLKRTAEYDRVEHQKEIDFLQLMMTDGTSSPAQKKQTGLDKRIPGPNPGKYKRITDAQNWLNPILTIQADGIQVASKGVPGGRNLVAPEGLLQALVNLPLNAWPYGRVVLASDTSIRATNGKDEASIKRNHQATEEILKELGVAIEWWPSA